MSNARCPLNSYPKGWATLLVGSALVDIENAIIAGQKAGKLDDAEIGRMIDRAGLELDLIWERVPMVAKVATVASDEKG